MKSSNKTNYLFGAVLLIISAIFTVSLTLQALDFGVTGPGRNNILYYLGDKRPQLKCFVCSLEIKHQIKLLYSA